MLNLNTLLSLIFQCKKTGAGKLGNGRIYVKLMSIISDRENEEISAELDILRKFGSFTTDPTAYSRIDKFLNRYIKTGKNYPFQLFKFQKFEDNYSNNLNYIAKTKTLCNEILDERKIQQFTYTLLEIIRQDSNVDALICGNRKISKTELLGSYAHPKRVCIEALLLGALYFVHKYSFEGKTLQLLDHPDRLRFSVVRYWNERSLALESSINLTESLAENTKRKYAVDEFATSPKRRYKLEMYCEKELITNLSQCGNVFIYGGGGSGKSTLMFDELNCDKSVNFIFPLYKYKAEFHENPQPESCWILVQILLKYFYQYEYLTYENTAACEGENEVLQRLTELNELLKSPPADNSPKYTLLLDGLNELAAELQIQLISELEYIVDKWINIRIVITGRTIPNYSVFDDFKHIEVCGVTDDELNEILAENGCNACNLRLTEVLKAPLFLNLYTDSDNRNLRTQGELLDSYIMNIQSRLPEESLVRFAVQYALPFAAKMMTDSFSYEIDRGSLAEAMDRAFEFYLLNERVFQNYIAPKEYRKKSLLESRENVDIVELLTDNVGFLTASKTEPQKLHFTHQYFRDYFAAKHIVNLGDALWTSYEYDHAEERTELFKKYGLDMMWFYDEDDIYRLIGEICGDYRNAPDDDFHYQRTVLDSILDMSKNISALHTAECVIKVMSLARGNVICGVDFSGQDLYFRIPDGVKFSLNGEYPCCFCYSWIFFLGISDITATAFTSDDRYRITAFENGYVAMWGCTDNRLVWEKTLSEFVEEGREFEYAIFSGDETAVSLISCNSVVNLDVVTGKIISSKNQKGYTVIEEFYDCSEKFTVSETQINYKLKREIFSQMNHFKDCDFSNAEFFDDEGQELLGLMGAVVD